MQNYSENWRYLKSILLGYTPIFGEVKTYTYADHTQAKALSIFIANANLATPRLDREMIEALLSGTRKWIRTLGEHRPEGAFLPLSLLEKYGLVAFYGNWCSVYCQNVKNSGDVDPSLIPLIQTIQYLKDICYGRNGYVRPHYKCSGHVLRNCLAEQIGGASVEQLLPELQLEDGDFKLPVGDEYFSPLVSTYLWLKLRETLNPKEAFERWFLCFRVNCSCAMPVLFEYLDHPERIEFYNQLLAYLEQDAALSLDIDLLCKQSLNADSFSRIIAPVRTQVSMAFDSEGNSKTEHRDIELPKPTLATLMTYYPVVSIDADASDLQFVLQSRKFRHSRYVELFYTGVLASVIDANIRIDGHVLVSHDFVDAVILLAASRPILKHLLFNFLLEHGNPIFKVFLLSRPSSCDVALSYLAKQLFTNSAQNEKSFIGNLEDGYQRLICCEYLRAIKDESDSGLRLFRVIEFLGEQCDLRSSDFSVKFEYRFLASLLESLNHQQVVQLGKQFSQFIHVVEKTTVYERSQHYWYFLGFWLMERIEALGAESDKELNELVKVTLLKYYTREFTESLKGLDRGLEPTVFFSALPWQRLVEHGKASSLSGLSKSYNTWLSHLKYSQKNNFAIGSAVRHYLQIMMCAARWEKNSEKSGRIAKRVVEIVCTLGFGSREEGTYLFDVAFYATKYDLWTQFCSYTNSFDDELYDDFIEKCLDLIPLDQLFILLERCTIISREKKLQDAIANRQSPETEDLGLTSLAKAFISASNSNNAVLAAKLIVAAKIILAQDRFSKNNNTQIVEVRNLWLSYEYKWALMCLRESSDDPDKFAAKANQVPIPIELNASSPHQSNLILRKECDQFRRYVTADAYRESNPERCVRIMEVLYKESSSVNHGFMLFKGRIDLCEKKKDTTGLRLALSQFISNVSDIEFQSMSSYWIAVVLDAYRQLHDNQGIDAFWGKLNTGQRDRVEVLLPYCRALIARGDALIAQQIVNRYLDLNQQTSEGLGLNELIDELFKKSPREQSLNRLIQVVTEESQRSVVQLTKHYNEIVSKEFSEYVRIVGQGKQVQEFLKDTVLEVAEELLLRRSNLQIHSKTKAKDARARLTHEDLINDWFTSLFDKRMAEARIGFRDQKRGGQSKSGGSPGEVDGYITDSKNRRIAIFEAFRLSSIETSVIFDHLDKISGYNSESITPIFIVAYCDVSDFPTLIQGYTDLIRKRDYSGYIASSAIEPQRDSANLWLGMERRYSNNKEITFYHLLLNMRC